jgi:TatA/E family protein of Tat protein translocase
MFGPLGIPELVFIFALALLIFGPRELPKIGRTIGKAMAEFRRASNELRRTLNTEMLEEELRQSDPRRILNEAASDLKNSVEKAGRAEKSDTAEALPGISGAEVVDPDASESLESTDAVPEVRVPAGQMARGDLPQAVKNTVGSTAKSPVAETVSAADSEEKP